MEDIEDTLLRFPVEIDQQVAAGNQVHPRKRGILQQIVRGEQHLFPYFTPNAIAAVLLDEEPLQSFFVDIGFDRSGVIARSRGPDCFFAEIARENLDRRRRFERRGVLEQQHGEGVRFFSGCARRHPHPHRVRRPLPGEKVRDVCLQRVERLTITEEIRDRDEHVLQQRPGLPGVSLQKADVACQILDPVDLHSPPDPAQNRGPLVASEIAAGPRAQKYQDLAERLLIGVRSRPLNFGERRSFFGWQLQPRRDALIFQKSARHLSRFEHPIDHPRVDRGARHARMLGFVRILGDREPAALLDSLDPLRAVAIQAGKHDRGRVRAVRVGERTKEHVHRDAPAARNWFGLLSRFRPE